MTTTTNTALPTGTWQLDATATSVVVAARKFGLLTIPATLSVTSGIVEIDESHQVSSVEIVADASSYASENDKRDEHVRSDDFLAADAHPSITFHATEVTTTPEGYRGNGTITIKGQTSPIAVTISDVEFDDENGSFTAAATVDRKAIGVAKMPTFVIGRQLSLTVAAAARRVS